MKRKLKTVMVNNATPPPPQTQLNEHKKDNHI